MRCCLVTAPTVTEFRSREELLSEAVQAAALQPQLGILNVGATLERCGAHPQVIDTNSEYLRYALAAGGGGAGAGGAGFADHLAGLLAASGADLYGFSSLCSTYPLSLRVAGALRQRRPGATILFGGPQASVVDVDTLNAFPFVDLILRGETEQTLPVLYEELEGGRKLERVPGLTYHRRSEIRRNTPGPIIEDLDQLPSPAYHLQGSLRGAAAIELGRGCPFSCTFCSTNDFFRRRFRLRSPQVVLADMRAIAAAYGIRHFELVHDMFTVDRKRVVAFCDAMLASGDGFTWDCSARTDCVDQELLEQMAASGCRGVFFGIETGSRRMQRIIDKDLDPARATLVLDIAERLGMRTTASLIAGFPEETCEDLRATLAIFMHSARRSLSRPQLNLLAPLAGTPVHAMHRHSMVLEDHYSDMSHQGLTQDPEDLALIRKYPDIFPNFYLLPVSSLPRETLFELREFLSMGVACLRWLLCAIDQETDLLCFHDEWRAWRVALRGAQQGSALRRYYATPEFRADLLEFIAGHALSASPAIGALVRAEQTVRLGAQAAAAAEAPPATKQQRTRLRDRARLAATCRLLELDYRLGEVIAATAERREPTPNGRTHYATFRNPSSCGVRLAEISGCLAVLLRACEDTPTVGDLFASLPPGVTPFQGQQRRRFLSQLLKGACARGLIEIERADQ